MAPSITSQLDALPFSSWHRRLFAVAFFGVLFDAADFAMFGAALPPVAREFGLGPAQAGLLATVGLVGAFAGALLWGTVADYIGRRTAFSATVGIFSLFTGLVALSWNVLSLTIFRFLANLGLGGEVPVATTLVAEFMPARIRGRTTVIMAASFPLGLIMAAGLSLTIIPAFGWRALFAVGVIPALLLWFVRRNMPESVRYLLSRGRSAEASAVVSHIRVQSGLPPLPAGASAAIPPEPPGVTVTQLLAAGRRRRTLLLWTTSFCYLWASNGIIFMLPTILTQRGLPLRTAIALTLMQASVGFVGYCVCGILIDRFGRRPVLFLYYFIGAFFHLAFALASDDWLFVAIAAVGFVNPGAYGGTSVYAGELYPTQIRGTAVGWFFGIGRIGSFLAPAVIGILLANSLGAWALYSFAVAYLIASIAVVSIGVETRGAALEAVADEDTVVRLANAD